MAGGSDPANGSSPNAPTPAAPSTRRAGGTNAAAAGIASTAPNNPLVGQSVMAFPEAGSSTRVDPATALACTVLDVKRGSPVGIPRVSEDALVFVRWRDFDRRFAEWVPADRIVADTIPPQGSSGESPATSIVGEPTSTLECYSGISAEQRAGFKNTMEFLEERLRRDMASPNSTRYLHYLGQRMAPWYYSPFEVLYPQFTHRSPVVNDAFLCPFTLTPFTSQPQLRRHLHSLARAGAPLSVPGREVYNDPDAGLSIMEVDGRQHAAFSRNVFLMSKCFLECKLVGHDTDLYVLYVVALHGKRFGASNGVGAVLGPEHAAAVDRARYFAGYYSYERGSVECNLACIVTLPCFQGLGLGRFLIEASYAIGYARGIVGSPERPLSELGRAAYDRYWAERIWRWALEEAVGAVVQRRPVQPGAYDMPPQTTTAGDSAGNALQVDGSDGANDSSTASSSAAAALAVMRVTVHDMAKTLRLDSGDVLETVQRLGLVHRTDGKALRLLVPVELARREVARVSSTPSPFVPSLLKETCVV